ncbi:MAG: DNA cytosine methyltransferase [Microcoleaceae cyanobacterium MO_207.B10]|nr:DNA cytosine methyltransferase [Microcoleaceae cyanobacterium MO_207.B10]
MNHRMQQLSLPLNIPNLQPNTTSQFQEILKIINITKSPGWPDKFGISIHNWFTKNSYSPIKTLSLFTGGGGLDIGFHDCGFQIVKMVELEAKYIKTLEVNSQPGKYLEDSEPLCINIQEYIPSPELEIDFIIGGPPCQTFSWGVNVEDIFDYLQCLRKIGYEVRNHNTNPQIIPGEYLIPYSFPTLTPKSVQLRKNLGTSNE